LPLDIADFDAAGGDEAGHRKGNHAGKAAGKGAEEDQGQTDFCTRLLSRARRGLSWRGPAPCAAQHIKP